MDDKMSFDMALKQLEWIVSELESGQLGLEESVQRFEEGIELALFCQKELKATEGKVSSLIQKLNGELALEEFAE